MELKIEGPSSLMVVEHIASPGLPIFKVTGGGREGW